MAGCRLMWQGVGACGMGLGHVTRAMGIWQGRDGDIWQGLGTCSRGWGHVVGVWACGMGWIYM